MDSIGRTGDPRNAYECGNTIGTYLKRYDFDIDFAPVADVNTNPENVVIGPRAFSGDPAVAAPMVVNYLQGLKDAGIISEERINQSVRRILKLRKESGRPL